MLAGVGSEIFLGRESSQARGAVGESDGAGGTRGSASSTDLSDRDGAYSAIRDTGITLQVEGLTTGAIGCCYGARFTISSTSHCYS